MTTIYAISALVGGTVLVCQFVLTLVGFGDFDHADVDLNTDVDMHFDVDTDAADGVAHADGVDHQSEHDSTWFFGIITFRTVVAALAFFGIVGLAGNRAGADAPAVLILAIAAGGGAMLLVHWMMQGLKRLKADGTARIHRALGRPATVYLKIPAARGGVGKVTVDLTNRACEYEAVTPNDELPTGARVIVTKIVGPETVEVTLASTPGE